MLAFNLCECVWSFALQLLQINFLISRNCEAFYYCRAIKTSWHINLRGWFVNYRNEMWKKKLTMLINRRTTMHIAKALFSLVATICTHTVNLLVTLRREREEKVKPLFIISTDLFSLACQHNSQPIFTKLYKFFFFGLLVLMPWWDVWEEVDPLFIISIDSCRHAACVSVHKTAFNCESFGVEMIYID